METLMSFFSVSMIPSVLQPNVSITASVGGLVILECHTTADLVVAWFWLKQIPGQKLNPIVSTYYQEIKLQEEFLNESRIQFKVDDKKSALIFTKINSRDARDHCGVLLYEKLYFGGGTYLAVNDAKPVKIIQHPVLDSHHVGDSVNLHCSIFGASCSGGQSVYWLRRESHSGIIYTDGDRKDQCETISVTVSTVQSCVHKVPKSLASDETYFCSVVTCGKLIVGNGTKLIADGKACFIAHIPIYSWFCSFSSLMSNNDSFSEVLGDLLCSRHETLTQT
uniref:Ig-like domain-containing protein n=1 Tax=Sinocyclocheilus grahami TaxID=75366 RepID=A0A672QYE5_SINGR